MLWQYNNKNFKMAIRLHTDRRVTKYIGVHQLSKYIGEKRANYIRSKMENLTVDKKTFEVQGKASVYVKLV